MIFGKLNCQNVKLTLVESNNDENQNEIYIELIFNKTILKDFIMTLLTIKEQNGQKSIPLTERERQVLKYLAEGKTNEEIAKFLNVTVHTAKAHVHNIFEKMEVQDRTQAVVRAIKQHIIDV